MKENKDDLSYKELRELDNANSKDVKMNTPQNVNEGISIMPHDEETLKTFNLKEMNFKDMTNAQKNTFIVVAIFLVLITIVLFAPTTKKMFGGITIGNLRFLPTDKKEETEQKSFAYAGDLFVIGNNTSVVVENIRFNDFTKGSNYSGLFNYTAQEDIEDVSTLKIYIEYYNYSKVLLKRFAFLVDGNSLKKGEKGTITNTLSENTFNKAHFVTVRVMSDAEIIEVPDPEEPGSSNEDPNNPSNPNVKKDNPNELTCKKVDVDNDVRINQKFFVEFENGRVKQYTVNYKISSVTMNSKSKKYSSYYKKILKKIKELDESYVSQKKVDNDLYSAILDYTVNINEYIGTVIDESTLKEGGMTLKEIYEKIYYPKRTYKLELDAFYNKSEAKKSLEKEGFSCD